MKQILALTVAAALLCVPAMAEDALEGDMGEGLDLMEEGARMLMRGLMSEMEPALDALRDNVEQMGPALGEFVQSVGPAFGALLEQIDDLRYYEAPEILPNGDIIIRRSPDAPAWEPEPDTTEIEL
ncbi:AAA+ family ATPase [Loktanella sp. 1ANDIMAR09]|nr:AAA+ family ATPase [Loktanella sp. 1ANDIMAR09]